MKYKGVVYDVGLRFVANQTYSIELFDQKLVKYDINVIVGDMHANVIRIEGEKITHLVTASRIAHKVGFTVFFNPWKDECAGRRASDIL